MLKEIIIATSLFGCYGNDIKNSIINVDEDRNNVIQYSLHTNIQNIENNRNFINFNSGYPSQRIGYIIETYEYQDQQPYEYKFITDNGKGSWSYNQLRSNAQNGGSFNFYVTFEMVGNFNFNYQNIPPLYYELEADVDITYSQSFYDRTENNYYTFYAAQFDNVDSYYYIRENYFFCKIKVISNEEMAYQWDDDGRIVDIGLSDISISFDTMTIVNADEEPYKFTLGTTSVENVDLMGLFFGFLTMPFSFFSIALNFEIFGINVGTLVIGLFALLIVAFIASLVIKYFIKK